MSLTLPALLRLLHLVSPTLPVGAYSYSQGLERAVEEGWVSDRATACQWIADVLRMSVSSFEAPLVLRLYDAWSTSDRTALAGWNDYFLAGRETAELRAETAQMGYSLRALIHRLPQTTGELAATLDTLDPLAFPTAFAGLAQAAAIGRSEALAGYLWAWLENQVLAAVKIVPLGQVAGQTILLKLADQLPACVEAALIAEENDIVNFCPALAIASARHEAQFARMFRS